MKIEHIFNSKYPKYKIILFCNKKRVKTLHKYMGKEKIMSLWDEYKKLTPPRYPKMSGGKPNRKRVYELGLIFPNYRGSNPKYLKDEHGRYYEVQTTNDHYRVREIIPYWIEEKIYDADNKVEITYDEFIEIVTQIQGISQFFTLNNKIVVQTDDKFRVFGNKNISDTQRLFEIAREDILSLGYGNFIFVRDIDRGQRMEIYDMMVRMGGYSKTWLFKHYSN